MKVEIVYNGMTRYYSNVVNVLYGRGIMLVFENGEVLNVKTRNINYMSVKNND